ncbi:MAG: hypothetical protein HOJ15_01570 [Candidatus Jacksonbacteria bacterium]|jgi:hypothetical protein|nr:hypothetical protein [Candidatus Jacksonbacteria bacterium]MBT6301098.1 hypothetical protein [Candidatus Jacksonbacteria bacterium]MBT6757221.1 hypothetical protein [Candidatus Jacksonbacteria bacterium]MBT6955337.1 hypothetical protein [Candidatus Jacksonbacteria bacterium]MBT7007950.1 hypothetical protein [Candidatus Jacksonbacteria bacterium]
MYIELEFHFPPRENREDALGAADAAIRELFAVEQGPSYSDDTGATYYLSTGDDSGFIRRYCGSYGDGVRSHARAHIRNRAAILHPVTHLIANGWTVNQPVYWATFDSWRKAESASSSRIPELAVLLATTSIRALPGSPEIDEPSRFESPGKTILTSGGIVVALIRTSIEPLQVDAYAHLSSVDDRGSKSVPFPYAEGLLADGWNVGTWETSLY